MEMRSADSKSSSAQSLDEKLTQIDQEIQALHHFCMTKGFNSQQIEQRAAPIWKYLGEARSQRRKIFSWIVVAVICILAALTCCNYAVRLLSACTRITMIKAFLPHWDWTRFYESDGCLLENPYFKGNTQELLKEECEICENVESLIRISNISQTTMAETHIKRDIPVIVTDGMVGWMAPKLFTLPFLYQLYNEDEVMKRLPRCMLASNIRVKFASVRFLLAKVFKNEYSNWYAHWEECEMLAVRILRQFFKRPYFIPPMVETAKLNWLLLSSNYNAKNYKPIDLGTSLMWLAQVKGKNRIRLVPRTPCNSTCSTLYTVLQEGEIVVWTDFLWLLDYQPINSGVQLNVAIASGGYFD